MLFSRLRFGFAFAGVALSLPGLAATFDGVGLNDTWPTSGWGSRADWSSELGMDYACGWGTNGSNTVMQGDGTGWSSRPLAHGGDAGFDLGWELNRKGGAAGETFSGGSASIANAGSLSSAISMMHLYSELGVNNVGHGISTNSYITSTMGIRVDYAWQPIYYALDWTVTYRGEGAVAGGVYLNGFGWDYNPKRELFGGWFSGSGTRSGTAYGMSNRYNNEGTYNYPLMEFGTGIGDNAGSAGSGRIDATVRIRFSTAPLDTVPEPTTTALMGLCVIPYVRKRLRKAR